MFGIVKSKIALISGAVAALVVLGGVSTCAIRERLHGPAQAVQAVRQIDEETAQAHTRRAAKITKKEAKQDAAFSQAVAANPEWASERVPDDILDSLRQ